MAWQAVSPVEPHDHGVELHDVSRNSSRDDGKNPFSEHYASITPTTSLAGSRPSDCKVDNTHEYQSPSEQPPAYAPDFSSRLFRGSWFWEILCCMFSIGCIAAIGGILAQFDHQALPSWPLGITLNALISLLAVLCKSAILVVLASSIGQLKWHHFAEARSLKDFETFDEASRGPLGSLLLLFRVKPAYLVTIGALLTVISVATDPFVQQIVAYEELLVRASDNSTSALRAQFYESGQYVNSGLQPGPESGMKSAIFSGLFGQPSSSDPVPVCQTGNCTFPRFTSLAICSQCVNVTDRTERVSVDNLGRDPNFFSDTLYNITYSLPGGVSMNVSYDIYGDGTDDYELGHGPQMVSKTDLDARMTGEMFNVSQAITALSILQFPYVNEGGYEGNYTSGMPLAWECALYVCVNEYDISVENGQPSTSVVSSWHDNTLPPVDYDVGATQQLPSDTNMTATNRTFAVSYDTLGVLSDYLNHTLAGIVLTDTTEVNAFDAYVDDVLQRLNVTSDIGQLFMNISLSMTAYIRGQAAEAVPGTAAQPATFVKVRWIWLLLPAALVVLATAFLVATMMASKARGDPVWKSGSLATLYHGLEKGARADQDSLVKKYHASEMNFIAKGTRVTLQRNSTGNWMLTPVVGR